MGIFDDTGIDGFSEAPQEQEATDEQQSTAAERVVSDLTEEKANNDLDEKMSEVEKRLELAQYYKLLLSDRIFRDESEAAFSVEEEIRSFIRSRLEVLLGVTAAPKPTPVIEKIFTEDEVKALKALASKVISKPQLVAQKPEVKEPPAPPSLNTRETTQPKPGLVSRTPQKPALVNRKPRNTDTVRNPKNVIPDKDGLLRENGKTFKMVPYTDVNGKQKMAKMDITPVVKPLHIQPIPMPSLQHMTQITEQQAAVNNSIYFEKGNPLIALAAQRIATGQIPVNRPEGEDDYDNERQ